MSSLNDLHFNINDFDGSKMLYIIPDNFGMFEYEIATYYNGKHSKNLEKNETIKKNINNESKDIYKKLFIKTGKMHCPFDPSENNYTHDGAKYKSTYRTLALSFRHLGNMYNENEVKQLKKFINMLDDTNRQTIMANVTKLIKKKKTENIVFKNCIVKSQNFPEHCVVNILPGETDEEPNVGVFDENGKESKFTIIKKNTIVSCVLEIRSVRLNRKKNEFRTILIVHQIRKWNEMSSVQIMYRNICLLIDEENPDDNAFEDLKKKLDERFNEKLKLTHYTQLIGDRLNYVYQPPPMYGMPYGAPLPPPPPPPSNTNGPPRPPPPPKKEEIMRPAFVVSADELKQAMSKLTKIKKE